MLKICNRCQKKITKLTQVFNKRNNISNECKKCFNKRKEYYYKNLNKIKIYSHEYFIKNREKNRINCKKYRNKNKEKIREQHRIYIKNKRHNNPVFRLRENIGKAINYYIKKQKNIKNGSAFKKLPFSIEQLKFHLEKLFDKKMNWNNYGKYWNLDHIYPQSKLLFNSMNHKNFYKCWKLSNLRPLKIIDNIRKNNKI